MSFVAKEGKKVVLAFLAIFIIAYLFFDSSFFFFLLLLFVIFIYKNPERELDSFDNNVILSPADMEISGIYVNEDSKKIEITCKKSVLTTGVLRAVLSTDKIDYEIKNGLVFADDENAKLTKIYFPNDVEVIFKNGFFTRNVVINKVFDVLKGQRIGFMLDGEIKLIIPYNSTLLIALGDKILANSKLAKLGE